MTLEIVLAKPSIHLNGTSQGELTKQYTKALVALEVALRSLEAAAPHPRDYYVQESQEYERARLQHQQRLRKLREVYTEIEALALHVTAF